ncbi:MAG: NTP transferase domain-containing protein [Bacteroidales bacterium]|nr:NTP transferase domain-containing protein [Bacteroidales bacterium]
MNNSKKYSAIILSAGKSSRMGVHKFSLKYNATTTFLENLINQFNNFGCEEIIVVLNPDGKVFLENLKLNLLSKIKIVINEHPEWERFYSLKLAANEFSKYNPTFVSNIDNPFVDLKVLELLAKSDTDYSYPVFNGRGGHPFLISERVIADLNSEPKDEIHLKEFLGRYSKSAITVNDEKVLLNVNTEEEYRRLFKI